MNRTANRHSERTSMIGTAPNITKNYMRTMLKRMINHRKFMYNTGLNYCSKDQMAAIVHIEARLSFIQHTDFLTHCKNLLMLKDLLYLIAPLSTSRYHKDYMTKLESLLKVAYEKTKAATL